MKILRQCIEMKGDNSNQAYIIGHIQYCYNVLSIFYFLLELSIIMLNFEYNAIQ